MSVPSLRHLLLVALSAIAAAACASSSSPSSREATAVPRERMGAAAGASEFVNETSSLRFHSAFWVNLHHVLYAEAWARRDVPRYKSLAGAFPAPLDKAALDPTDHATWTRAVDYYERELADKDLLFDDTMGEIRKALAAAEPAAHSPSRLPAEQASALAGAARVYRAHWWAAHDRANRAWIEGTVERVRSLSPGVPDRLARLYGTPWFTTPIRVDVAFVANRQSAYTTTRPKPHITVSSSDPYTQGWAAAEIVFHEASHALVGPVEEAFAGEARAQAKSLPVLWHIALFYLSGEVVRQTLATRAIDYTPYLYKKGLFARGWEPFQQPIETHWRPYVDGRSSLGEAVKNVVTACPSG
jgi:hypothetical protein